jgi:hypothetical protein
VFFGAPGGNFDLASFSFHVPIFELAKPTANATKHRATVNTIVLVLMSLLIDKRIFELIEAPDILVSLDRFGNRKAFNNTLRTQYIPKVFSLFGRLNVLAVTLGAALWADRAIWL